MSSELPEASSADRARGRLRLKRWFLRTLVVSLSACALVAVVVLLLGKFNETTARVLLTLAALAVHSGLAIACAESLERRRWPKLSTIGLILFTINFGVLITCIWWPRWLEMPALRAVLTTGVLIAAYVLAMPAADLQERGRRTLLAAAGLVMCAVALAMVLACIWAEDVESVAFAKATAIAAIAAFTLAHACLLVRVPSGPMLGSLRRSTMVCAAVLATLAAVLIIWEIEDEWCFRVLGALGVLDASGSLGLLILARLRKIGKVEKLASTAAELELRCPRCTTTQTVAVGPSRCTTCGLKFRIEIEEPRCANCDYLLWKLPERRCPECGTEF